MKIVKSLFFKILKFLSLSDYQGNLSISNIAVIIIITKMAIAPFDWVTAASLMIALLNYSHKRKESNEKIKGISDTIIKELTGSNKELAEQVEATQKQVKSVVDKLSQYTEDHEAVAKSVEEVKSTVSKSSLVNALNPRGMR